MGSILPQTNLADACLVAETWGFDDALSDIRPRVAAYFDCDSPQWDAYDTGYQAGIELLFRLTGGCSARQLGIVTAPKAAPERQPLPGAPTETWEDIQDRYGYPF